VSPPIPPEIREQFRADNRAELARLEQHLLLSDGFSLALGWSPNEWTDQVLAAAVQGMWRGPCYELDIREAPTSETFATWLMRRAEHHSPSRDSLFLLLGGGVPPDLLQRRLGELNEHRNAWIARAPFQWVWILPTYDRLRREGKGRECRLYGDEEQCRIQISQCLQSLETLVAGGDAPRPQDLQDLQGLMGGIYGLEWNTGEVERLCRAIQDLIQVCVYYYDNNKYARSNLLHSLGKLYRRHRLLDSATAALETALAIRQKLAQAQPGVYLPEVALTLNNLGAAHTNRRELDQAVAAYEEALAIRRELAEAQPGVYLPDVAMILNNLGIAYRHRGEPDQAVAAYEEALRLYRALAEAQPGVYLPDIAMTENNLRSAYADRGELDPGERVSRKSAPSGRPP